MLKFFANVTARKVANLLRDRPEEWSDDTPPLSEQQYRITHSSGLTVWVPNEAYGLHLETPDAWRLWGVTMWCLVGGSPNQQCVWSAYKKWAKNHPFRPNGNNISAFVAAIK